MKEHRVLGLIIARAGSKTVPNKNMRILAGKPLLEYTLKAATASEGLDKIIISTDSPEMARFAESHDVEAPFIRPTELSNDTAQSHDVILHALEFLQKNNDYQPDGVMLLQPTSPFRTSKDISECVRLFSAENVDGVVSITPADKHPYTTKMLSSDGRIAPFFPQADMTANRQTWPKAYLLNGAIFLRQTAVYRLWRSRLSSGGNPEGKRVLGYVMPPERSIDIDNELDFLLAESIITKLGISKWG